MNNLKNGTVQTTGHRDFHDYDSFVYQNDVKPKISDRRVASVEIIWNHKRTDFLIGEDYFIKFRLDIPLNVGMIQNKVLIDYKYSEEQYKKDKQIMDEHFDHLKYGQWSKSTIREITQSSMRIQNYEDNKIKLNQFNRGDN